MKKVALFICFAFVGSMALTTLAVTTSTTNDGLVKVSVEQEKPCPKDCKCDKCTKDKAACDKEKKECKKENAETKKCCKAADGEKKCDKAKENSSEKTQTSTAEPEKK